MLRKAAFFATLASLGFWLGGMAGAIADQPEIDNMNGHNTPQSSQFHRIEQPLSNKVIVTLGGLGLIGLELWWFVWSKPKSR
jgi:plastocyanin domain-containing protein